MDLSGYALSLLRSGDLTLHRGTGKGVASILLVTAENGSLVYLNRLEREYALRGELDAAWAARPGFGLKARWKDDHPGAQLVAIWIDPAMRAFESQVSEQGQDQKVQGSFFETRIGP